MIRKIAMSLALVGAVAATAQAEGVQNPWTLSLGGGVMFYEGDSALNPSQAYVGRVGYDLNPRWTLEASVGVMPFQAERDENIDEVPALGDNWSSAGMLDALYFLRDKSESQWDPFAAVSVGVLESKRDFGDGKTNAFGGAGLGVAYNINEALDVRADYRALVVGNESELNQNILISLVYRVGASDAVGLRDGESPLHTIYFPFDSSTLSEEAKAKLRTNAEWLAKNPDAKVILEGHCDERGTQDYNYALGERRSRSAYDYLRTLGVAAERLETMSYGEDRPADAGHNEAAWTKNRRVVCALD